MANKIILLNPYLSKVKCLEGEPPAIYIIDKRNGKVVLHGLYDCEKERAVQNYYYPKQTDFTNKQLQQILACLDTVKCECKVQTASLC